MTTDWYFIELGELVNEITVGFVGSMIHEYVDDGVPFFRSKNISEYEIEWNDIRYISQDFHRRLKKSILRPGDVVIVRTGKPGTACVIPDSIDEANCSDIVIVRVNNDKLSAHYLSYFMNSIASHQVSSHLVGAVQQHFNVGSAKKIKIPLPTRDEQEEIVKILKSLDDKRKLNRQINQTLEAMAQAIFKSWFVDFEPVKAKIAALKAGEDAEGVTRAAMRAISGKTDDELDKMGGGQPEDYAQLKNTAELFPSTMQDSELGEVPEGWDIIPFSKLANLDTTSVKPHNEPDKLWEHYSIPAFDVNEAPHIELGSEIKSNKYKVNPIAILSSKLNPNTPRTWWPDVNDRTSAICSTEFMQFIPNDAIQRAFIFGLITSDNFQSGIKQRVTGSTGSRQRAQPRAVAEMDVVNPKEELKLTYCSCLTELYILKAKNIKDNITLAKLRDTLLPKLLSGELSVYPKITKEQGEQ